MLAALAGRNVLRNRRRSAITILSMALGLAALTFVWAFIDGMNRQMVVNSTRLFAGDIQVHVKGYHADPSLDRAMDQARSVLARSTNEPNVAAATLRLEGTVLASHADKSRGLRFVGVDPAQEARVSDLLKTLVSGNPLVDDAPGLLIGEVLARALGVLAGEELVLTGQAWDGSIAAARLVVQGIFSTRIDELDGRVVVAPLSVVREFFAAPDGATAIVARLVDRDRAQDTRDRLQQRLGPQYEALSWQDLLPMVRVMARFHEVTAWIVLLVFFGIVAAAVANPLLMSVLERGHEFGVVLALGMSRSRLFGLVLAEAALLGLSGLVVGNLLGLAVTALFGRIGIDLSAFGSALRTMPGLENVTYPFIRLDRSVMISAVVFATVALTSMVPAAKAARLDPVAAMRGLAASMSARSRVRPSRATGWPVFVVMAARNLLRNRRRTLISAGGTAFGIVAFVFLFGYFDGFGEELVDNSTRYLTGHAQLERTGFRTDYAPELAFDDAAAILAKLRTDPSVAAAAPRVQVPAMASSSSRSEGILLIGVDPQAERELTFVHRTVIEGEALAPGGDRSVLIGRDLVRKLGLRLGERVVIMAQTADGELGSAAYRIAGIFATESSTFDGAMAFVTLPAAQSLTGLGSRVSTINLRLHERNASPDSAARLLALAGAPGTVLALWQDLLPQVDQMVRLTRILSNIVLAIAFVVIAAAIVNTVYMSVAERTREFGVMMALGTPPAAIQRMVVYETLGLTLLASAVGYGVGMALVIGFGRSGIDLSGYFRDYASIPGLTGIVHPLLIPAHLILPGLVLFAGSVLVSIIPARRAARLDPVLAIRHA